MQKRVLFTSTKCLSIIQICLLVSMTFAFSFSIGQEFKIVSAADEPTKIAAPAAPTIANTPTMSLGAAQTSYSALEATSFTSSVSVGAETIKVAAITDPAAYGITKGVEGAAYSIDKAGSIYSTVGGSTTLVQSGYSYEVLGIKGTNFFAGNFLSGLQAAVGIGGLVYTLANMFGASQKQSLAYGAAIGSGILGAKIATGLFGRLGARVGSQGIAVGKFGVTKGITSTQAGYIGVGIAVAVLILMYKSETEKKVTFQCLPWEPQLGGAKCEECNKDPMKPCSEYRCKALGQACELLNKGTDNAQCAWVSKGDVQSPTIQEWTAALIPTELQYTPAGAVRPGARGVTIVSPETTDGCIPAFTALEFGVLTNEPAQCKIDYNRSVNYSDMRYYFGESNFYEYNHTQRMRLPSPNGASEASPLLQNDGSFALSVRCQDANGNVNEDEYTINFCVSKGPDTTPPIVEGTSIESGSPVRFGADNIPMEVYTNEPATCKWSTTDRDYVEMENTLACATDATQVNADLQYTCFGNFSSVANDATQQFFVRCQDQPSAPENERNTMSESYKVSLRGSRELTLLSAGPNATTIAGSTSAVSVELFAQTDDGADQGQAICYFSPTGEAGSYLEFYETGEISHKQTLQLSAGNYTYNIRCIDAGGNNAETAINFGVAMDNKAPEVARVYKRGDDALQIITNEDAQCFYSKTSCNFEIADGLQMTYPSVEQQRVHLTQWKVNSAYYIKCKDAYGNQPSPNSCSIVVSGSDISAKAVVIA